MQNVLTVTNAIHWSLGDNLVGVVFALAAGATLLIANPVRAMGDLIPTEPSGQVCSKSIAEIETNQTSCPTKYSGQVIEDALAQQLCGEQTRCWEILPFTGDRESGWTIHPKD